MSIRAYVLIETVLGKSEQAARILRGKPGVIRVDHLDGRPDLMVVVEAAGRQRLAELTVQALSAVESVTEAVRLLPPQMRRSSVSQYVLI